MKYARLALVCGLSAACSHPPHPQTSPDAADPAVATTQAAATTLPPATANQAETAPALSIAFLREQTRILSQDEMQGRKPGTEGAKLAVAHLVKTFEAMGVSGGMPDGSYLQTVPMRSVQTNLERSKLEWTATGKRKKTSSKSQSKSTAHTLVLGNDIVASNHRAAGEHSLDAPLVFLGYGITAPAERWDDYANVDVRGKIVVVFIGDPPLNDGRFGGPAMTYYGRWTYKYERALAAGAAGCLIVHETEPASYGWNVVQNSWSQARFQLVKADGTLPDALQIEGWITAEVAAALAQQSGSSLAKWHELATSAKFRAFDIGARLHGNLTIDEARKSDVNVVARIPGSTQPEQAVAITAHWDHLGVDPEATGDRDAIFNGAVDNASGVAATLGVAAGIMSRVRAGQPPQRSILFVLTTAEEQGLLGSQYFAAHPSLPLEQLLGVVNLDSMNVEGRTKSIQIIGPGQTTLEDTLRDIGTRTGRTIVPDAHPEAGGFYRSDHFSFAKHGVPAIYFRGSADFEAGGLAEGERIGQARARRYHTVADEFDPQWSFAGTLQDAETVMELVLRVANDAERPRWKPGSEFANVMHPE